MRLFLLSFLAVCGAWGFVAPSLTQTLKTTTQQRPHSFLSASGNNANERIPMQKGSSCALITPMTSTGDIDVPSLRQLLQLHLDSGTDNLCILGTTAEASVMSMEERATVLSTAVDMCKGKIPLLVGTGTINPAHVKEMTQQAIDLGADANLVVSPYYVKPPQRGLIRHFTEMADMGLPVVIYNIPGRTGVDFLDTNLAICAEHENIVGLKDATGYLNRVKSARSLIGDDFLLYSGDDATSVDFVLQGGDGCISVTANLVPKLMRDIMHTALDGKQAEVEALNEPLQLLHHNLFCESNPIPAKWAAKRMGLIETAYCRPPLDALDPECEATVEEALQAAGLI